MRPLDPSLASSYPSSTRRPRPRSSPTGADRRQNPRFPLANTEIGNHAVTGRVLDLSRAGMAIECHDALGPGRLYTFRLAIGEHTETLTARLLWCRLCRTERLANGDVLPIYRAGIERLPLGEEADADSDPRNPLVNDRRGSSGGRP